VSAKFFTTSRKGSSDDIIEIFIVFFIIFSLASLSDRLMTFHFTLNYYDRQVFVLDTRLLEI
jgi:hypothetical protein